MRALTLLALLVFPVISVSDDLQMNLMSPTPGFDAPFCGDLLLFAAVLALLLLVLQVQRGWFVLARTREFCCKHFEFLNVTKRPPPNRCFA